jgi:hypothetical protein
MKGAGAQFSRSGQAQNAPKTHESAHYGHKTGARPRSNFKPGPAASLMNTGLAPVAPLAPVEKINMELGQPTAHDRTAINASQTQPAATARPERQPGQSRIRLRD